MERQEEIISEIPSPPPYSTHLPSYDEISQSLSPLQTQTTSETDQTEQPNSQSDSALLPPAVAPPAYDEIIQYPTTGGQPYNSPVQQPVVANVQQNQTHAESGEGEGLQQRIARRMAAIDAEIHRRSGQVTHGTVHSRNNVLPQQGSSHAREAAVHNQHSHRPNQPHHNSIQIPPANVQHQGHARSNEGLQQRIERRMATRDEQMHQRQAGRTLGTSTTVHSRTNAYQQQGTPRAQSTTVSSRYSYQLNQPRHNILQRPPAVAQSPRNVQQNQSDDSLQQRIARRMAEIDLQIRHQRAGRALGTSRTVHPRTDAYQQVRRNQSHAESGEGEGLQEQIARRMAAIDEEIHQRQAGIMPAAGTSHASVTAQSAPNRPSQTPSHHNTGWQPMASTHSQQSSTAVNSESSLPQGSNINTEEGDLQSRLERRFAAIDNSIRRRRTSQENRQKDRSCFCFPFLHKD